MSDFTIEQLEALKEGVTPGPWEAKDDHGGPNLFSPTGRLLHSDSCGDVSGAKEDVDLMAAAPALVDALIAEKRAHQKLRAEVEEQRDAYAEDGESVGASQEEQLTFEAHRQVARDLTRILEGE